MAERYDGTNADAVHCAYLPDPVKIESEAGYPSPALLDALAPHVAVTTVTVDEVLDGCLTDPVNGFTVLCIPGGFVYNYAARLGRCGAWRIRDFVDKGGGYVGVCAGAFLGSRQGLGLLDVDCVDLHRWARGSGPCQLRFTAEGAKVLGAVGPASTVTVR